MNNIKNNTEISTSLHNERITDIRRELAKKQANRHGIGFAYSAIEFLLGELDRQKEGLSNQIA